VRALAFREGIACSLLDPIEAALVCAHVLTPRIGQVVINNAGLCPSLPATLPGW
jgi:hypothetical protein